MTVAYKKLYFGTDGMRGPVGGPVMNASFMLRVGLAIGRVFAKNNSSLAVIGKDTRVSGYLFESSLQAGLISAGIDVLSLGTAPTPAVSHLVQTSNADFGIVISASHNPYFDNGIKLFNSEGLKISDEIEFAIERELENEFVSLDSDGLGSVNQYDEGLRQYEGFCENAIGSPCDLKGIKMVLDCANGATFDVAPEIFARMGATVTVIAAEPDGFNINDSCGSTDTEALQAKVISSNADLGIAFDGDGDRVIMVDHQGEIVDGDQILFCLANSRKASRKMLGGVVGTHMSNVGLELALQKLEIPFQRSEVGDRFVMQKLLENRWSIGGEASGHILNLDICPTGDAIVVALQVLSFMKSEGKSLRDMVGAMEKFPQVLVNIKREKRLTSTESNRLEAEVDINQRRLGGSGRIYIRPSGTEPLIRVMVEGEDRKLIDDVARELSEIIRG